MILFLMAGLKLWGWLVPVTLGNKHSTPWWHRAEPSNPNWTHTLQFKELRRDVSLSYSVYRRSGQNPQGSNKGNVRF